MLIGTTLEYFPGQKMCFAWRPCIGTPNQILLGCIVPPNAPAGEDLLIQIFPRNNIRHYPFVLTGIFLSEILEIFFDKLCTATLIRPVTAGFSTAQSLNHKILP
jgi:hypothetical protein